jgi:hypothetical protein
MSEDASLESLAELGKGMQSLLQSEEVRKKLLKSLIGPNGNASGNINTTMPYYKEKFAERIKPVVDAMLKDGQPRIVLYADYPSIIRSTLYLQQQQAIKWLSENNPQYLGCASKIMASKGKTGVVLRYYPGGADMDGPIVAHVISQEDAEPEEMQVETKEVKIKPNAVNTINKIRNFIDSPKAGPLQVPTAGLTHEDMSSIEIMLSGAKTTEEENLYYRVTDDSIKIVRVKDRKEDE